MTNTSVAERHEQRLAQRERDDAADHLRAVFSSAASDRAAASIPSSSRLPATTTIFTGREAREHRHAAAGLAARHARRGARRCGRRCERRRSAARPRGTPRARSPSDGRRAAGAGARSRTSRPSSARSALGTSPRSLSVREAGSTKSDSCTSSAAKASSGNWLLESTSGMPGLRHGRSPSLASRLHPEVRRIGHTKSGAPGWSGAAPGRD